MIAKTIIGSARRLSFKYQKPICFCHTENSEEWLMLKERMDFPMFKEPDDALKALASSLRHYRKKSEPGARHPKRFEFTGEKKEGTGRAHRTLGPDEAFGLLKAEAIPTADYRVVSTYDEGVQAAEAIGYPVVVKTADADITHKTEAGGVRLNIGNPDELRETFRTIKGNAFLVQKMCEADHEVFIGGKHDPEFGPVIFFGMGGIFVEALRDIVLRVAPLTEKEAEEMIEEIKGFPLLEGHRGRPRADIKALTDCLVRASRLLYEHPEIQTLDMNPVMVLKEGSGCCAVDVKILLSERLFNEKFHGT
jgi:acyl-CoA synthetase (NDP forming)